MSSKVPMVELVFDSDCPNVPTARASIAGALQRLALPLDWREYVIGAPDTPLYARNLGSPTILVDGEDVATSGGGADACCRVYVSGSSMAGAPSIDEVVRALRAALKSPSHGRSE